jgi:hypothetical protein
MGMFAWKWRNGTLFDADHKHKKQHGGDASSSEGDLAEVDAKADLEAAVVPAATGAELVQVAEVPEGDVEPSSEAKEAAQAAAAQVRA